MSELSQSQAKERPVGVTILAILAGIAAVLAAIHALQFIGIFPFLVGPSGYTVHFYSWWYALMYGLLFWVYIWLTMALWRVQPGAWTFLVLVTLFYPLQWHHPAVLHATRREDSFCHGVIRVLKAYPCGYALKHQSK